MPSTVVFSPEISHTSLYQTIFHLNLFIIRGKVLTTSPLSVHGQWVVEAYLKPLSAMMTQVLNQLKGLSKRPSWDPLQVLYLFNFFCALCFFHLVTELPLWLQHSCSYPWILPLAAIASVVRGFCPSAGQRASC